MSWITKRTFFFTFLLLTIFTGYWFRQPILSLVLKHSVQGYFRYALGMDLQLDKIRNDGKRWVLERPVLSNFSPWGKEISADLAYVRWHSHNQQIDVTVPNGLISIGESDKPEIIQKAHFQLDGKWGKELIGNAVVWLDNPQTNENKLDLKLCGNAVSIDICELGCAHVGRFALNLLPEWRQWNISDGILNGKVSALMKEQALTEMTGEVVLKHLVIQNNALGIVGSVPDVRLQLSENSEFAIEGPASCIMQHEENVFWQLQEFVGKVVWPLNQSAQISFTGVCRHAEHSFPVVVEGTAHQAENVFKKIKLRGEYAGFHGDCEIDLTDPERIMTLHLTGEGSHLGNFFPHSLRSRLQKKIDNDSLVIDAAVSQTASGVLITGILNLHEKNGESFDKIDFGINFETQKNYALKRGWFDATKLSLDKYVAPLIFDIDQLQLSGQADVSGVFDSTSIVLHYNAKDLALASRHFELNCANLASSERESIELAQPAVHYFDFRTGAHGGQIPLHNACYLERNSGLLFTNTSAQVTLGQQGVYVSNIEALCDGVHFSGAVDVDYCSGDEWNMDVGIYPDVIDGKVSQVCTLLSHFQDVTFLQHMPLDGNISLTQKGCIHFAIRPNGIQTQACIYGTLTEGKVTFKDTHLSLHDLSANFEYDHLESLLAFTDIQGTMLVGSSDHVEEYVIAGEHVKIHDFSKKLSEYDFWIGDKNRDIVRIAGKTKSLPDSSDIVFQLNHELSHFGDVHPDVFQLVLNKDSQLESLKLQFGFGLGTLLKDLQRLSRTGLLHLSPSIQKGINDLKEAEGDFDVDIQYDRHTALLTYHVSSQNSTIDKYTFKECSLEGKKRGSTWTIDELKLDDFSIAADLTHDDSIWVVNFLGFRCGEWLLMGLNGEYNPDINSFSAKINLLEITLEHLHKFPQIERLKITQPKELSQSPNGKIEVETGLTSFVNQWRPKGELRASGTILAEWGKGNHGIHVKTLLNTTLRNGQLQDIPFQDAENFSFCFDSDRGITISNLQSAVKNTQSREVRTAFNIGKIDYDLSKHELVGESIQFHVPSQNLPWIATLLKKKVPTLVDDLIADNISRIKSQGSFDASLDFKITSKHPTMCLTLPSGKYWLGGNEVAIEKAILEYDSFELRAKALYRHEDLPVWFSLRTGLSNLSHGQLVATLQEPKLQHNAEAITIHWQRNSHSKISIQKVEGKCAGIDVNLVHDGNSNGKLFSLSGKIVLELTEKNLLPQQVQRAFDDWKIGGRYTLSGHWSATADDVEFIGNLLGHNSTLNGYHCETLSANLEGSSNRILLKDIHLNDVSGSIAAKIVKIFRKNEEDWQFTTPSLTVSEFHPSLLRAIDGPLFPPDSTFVIREMTLHNFSGLLSDPATFQAQGEAFCLNPPKRDQPNAIWAIPTDVLSNFGLNLSVLCPVAGTIQFQVADKRIYLTKFKDMYSAGKLSKFYLPKKQTMPYYIDFDGNISLQVRMKQTSLLFKLAELVTVNIQGTLQNPTYSVFKQFEFD